MCFPSLNRKFLNMNFLDIPDVRQTVDSKAWTCQAFLSAGTWLCSLQRSHQERWASGRGECGRPAQDRGAPAALSDESLPGAEHPGHGGKFCCPLSLEQLCFKYSVWVIQFHSHCGKYNNKLNSNKYLCFSVHLSPVSFVLELCWLNVNLNLCFYFPLKLY